MEKFYILITLVLLAFSFASNLKLYKTGDQPKPRTRKGTRAALYVGGFLIIIGAAALIF